MVALTGELGEPPAASSTCGRSTTCAASPIDGAALVARRADDVHGHPALGAVSRARPGARRRGRDDRGGPDPEPRHARRQHRECLARRRHAAGPARGGCRRSCSGRGGASGRSRPARLLDRPTGGPRSRPTSCCCASGSRSPTGREMRFRKVGTRRAQSISKVVLAVAGGRDAGAVAPRGAWRDVRVALGSVAATPIRARATEAVLEGRAADPGDGRPGGGDPGRRADADRRRPLDRRVPPARGRSRAPPDRPRGRRLVTGPGADPTTLAALFEGRRGSSRGWGWPAVRLDDAELLRERPRHRPRDAGRRADRADRRPPAARGAARDGVGDELSGAGVRPGSRHARRTSRAELERLNDAYEATLRVPLLRLRRGPVSRGAAPRVRRRARRGPRRRDASSARRRRRHRHGPACEAVRGGPTA